MKQLLPVKITQFVRWHRTGVALLALFIALLAGFSALASRQAPGTPMVVAAHDLAAGAMISDQDVMVVTAPEELHPDGSFTSTDDLIGRPISVGLTRGTPLTTAALTTSALTDQAAGELLVPFRVRDPDVAALLQVGDHLTIVTSTPEGLVVTVAEHVRVAQLPAQASGGVWGNAGTSGALIVVAAPGSIAQQLAAASDQWLGVIIE